MAGFANKVYRSFKNNSVGGFLKDLSSLGMQYDDMVIQNSEAIGAIESQLGNSNGLFFGDDYSLFLGLSINDVAMRKNHYYFMKEYPKKRDELRHISLQDEIEEILDTMSDEAIFYDERNFFCKPLTLSGPYKESKKLQLEKQININFKKIYQSFGFNDDVSAWNYFRKWLIDGFLAFEIIYDDLKKPNTIIGFKELDPVSLTPSLDENNKKIWIQYKGDHNKQRVLYDSQIIYISYSQVNAPSRISYVERLIRPFNILRIMEHTRIIWSVVNASFKTKFIIPVGGKSKNRSKQNLKQLMNNYRESFDFDVDSGNLTVDGRPTMPFNKEYWLPSRDGEVPEIENVGGDGPDLNDTESLAYFANKLKLVSKIPFNRFEKDGGSIFETGAEGTARDEIKFGRFVNRLQSLWQEILVKPLYLQTIIDFPEFKDDDTFKEQIGIRFNQYKAFEEDFDMIQNQRKVDYVQNMRALTYGPNDTPYFPMEYLVEDVFKMSAEEKDKLKNAQEEEAKEYDEIQDDDFGNEEPQGQPIPGLDDFDGDGEVSVGDQLKKKKEDQEKEREEREKEREDRASEKEKEQEEREKEREEREKEREERKRKSGS